MTQLIAREQQLARLDTILENARQGRLQIVFITGEAGAGKTVLMDAFVERAKRARPELFTAGSKCHAIAGGHQEPYLPFVQILEALVGDKEDQTLTERLRRLVGDVAPDWIAAIPVIGASAAAVTRTVQAARQEFSDHGTGIDTQRRMVQYANALRQIASAMPLLLWIDDLHWSDSATLNLISFLADHANSTRIMLMATYRPTDIAHKVDGLPHPTQRLVSKLERHQQCSEVAVPSFTRVDVETLLSRSQHRFPEAFVTRLWRNSGGNPLFVQQYVIWLHERRLVRRKRGAFILEQPDIEVQIPGTIQDVISQRLSLMGDDLRRVLAYASVQGERFASCVLTNLLTTSELDVLEKLNALDRVHNLIREVQEPHLIAKIGTQYQFIHVLIQQALYNGLSAGQRRYLHLTIAQRLEQLYAEDANRYAADLATHFERGGAYARAIDYYLQASRNALDVLALDDALDHASIIRRLAEQMGEDERVTGWHVEALLRIAEAHYWKADYQAVLEACDEGEQLCQQGRFAEQHAYLLYWRCRTLGTMEHWGNSLKSAKRALQILGNVPPNPRVQGYLNTHLARLYSVLSLTEVQQAVKTALELAEVHQLADLKAKALIRKAWIVVNRMDNPAEALRLSQKALTIAQKHNFIPEKITCHRFMAYATLRLKQDKEESFLHNQQAVKLAKQSGMPGVLHKALGNLALSLKEIKENWKAGLTIIHEAIALAQEYHYPNHLNVIEDWFCLTIGLGLWLESEKALASYRNSIDPSYPRAWGFYYWQVGHLAYSRGLFKKSIEAYNRALDTFDKHGSDQRDMRRVEPYLGLAFLQTVNVEQALKHLKQAYSYWHNRQTHYLFARTMQGLARVDLVQDNPTQAITRLREALTSIEESNGGGPWPVWPYVCTDLGRALLMTGEHDEALQHALFGYGKFKKIGHFLLGEAAFVVGQVLVAQGKKHEALAYLGQARDDWRRLGLTHHVPAWEAFMEEHGLV